MKQRVRTVCAVLVVALLVQSQLLMGCSDEYNATGPVVTGTITIDAEPDALDPAWSLAGPDGFSESGNGDRTLSDMSVGGYTLMWGDAVNWVTPSSQTIELASAATIQFVGAYSARAYPLPLVSDGVAGRHQVIDNLKLAYNELNFVQYDQLLHNSYIFRFDPTEIDAVGQLEFSHAKDVASTHAMMSGQIGQERVLDAGGNWTGEYVLVPSVQAIRIGLTSERPSPWDLIPDGEFAGAWSKTFDVFMTVTYSGSSKVDTIVGKQVFHVVPGIIVEGEVEFDVWQLRAWADMGIFTAAHSGQVATGSGRSATDQVFRLPSEPTSVGQLKARF